MARVQTSPSSVVRPSRRPSSRLSEGAWTPGERLRRRHDGPDTALRSPTGNANDMARVGTNNRDRLDESFVLGRADQVNVTGGREGRSRGRALERNGEFLTLGGAPRACSPGSGGAFGRLDAAREPRHANVPSPCRRRGARGSPKGIRHHFHGLFYRLPETKTMPVERRGATGTAAFADRPRSDCHSEPDRCGPSIRLDPHIMPSIVAHLTTLLDRTAYGELPDE